MRNLKYILLGFFASIFTLNIFAQSAPPPPPEHGLGGLTFETQILNIPAGWSGISSYLHPTNDTIEDMFQAISDELIILQGQDGFYWPGENINTLISWNSSIGYKIKVSDDVELSLVGTISENKSVSIYPGWNLIPVKSKCSISIADLLNASPVTLVKEVAGTNIYWPEFNINTIGSFKPGQAYLAYASQFTTITFPECTAQNTSEVSQSFMPQFNNLPWQLPSPSSNTHIIAIPSYALSDYDHQKVLAAFGTDGKCYGLSMLSNQNNSITLFGDDPTTAVKDGFSPSETVKFRIFDMLDREIYQVSAVFDPEYPQYNGLFETDGLSVISNLKLATLSINKNEYFQVHLSPNPANDYIRLYHNSGSSLAIRLVDMQGKLCKETHVSTNEAVIDVAGLPNGIYTIICISATNYYQQKIIIH